MKLFRLFLVLALIFAALPAHANSIFDYRTWGVNSGMAVKAPVKAATTHSITLSGAQTIDGISVTDHLSDTTGLPPDRVLVKNQSDLTTNGIYNVSSGAWTRAADFDGPGDVVSGSIISVIGGTQAGLWQLTTADPIVIASATAGASNIVFTSYINNTLSSMFSTPIGSLAPVLVPCDGSGDEQAFLTAAPIAGAAKVSLLMGNGCQPANQWILSGGTFTSVIGWGGASTDINTAGSVVPRMSIFSAGIAQNAPGASFLDMHGPNVVSLRDVNWLGSDVSQPMTIIDNSVQNGGCCARNALQINHSSLGQSNAAMGCPVDGNLNCIGTGGIYSGTLTAGGSAYGNGTYNKVPLTGGSGTTAFADQIVVSGGAVTSVLMRDGIGITYPGKNYLAGDVLSASNTNLGGTGSGFQFTVTGLTKATPTAANVLPRIDESQIANIGGCGMCWNSSDILADRDEWGGIAGVAIQPIFGGGGNQLTNQRCEFSNSCFIFGGPNGSSDNGATLVANSLFTHTQSYDTTYRTTPHNDLAFMSGDGYIATGVHFNEEQTTDTPLLIGGGAAPAKNISIGPAVVSGGSGGSASTHLIEIKNSTGAVTPDYVSMIGLVANGGAITAPVLYTNVPAHFVEDSLGPGGQHWESANRGWGRGSSPPSVNATMDLSSDTKALALPSGTTGQRPTGINGDIRYNSTTPGVEAYVNGSWTALGGSGTTTIGNFQEQNLAVGSAVSLTTATNTDLTNMTPVAGDWDVSGVVCFHPGATTVIKSYYAWANTASVTPPTAPASAAITAYLNNGSTGVVPGANDFCQPFGPARMVLNGSTVVYLSTQSVFGTSTLSAYGYLRARRMN